MRAAGLPMPGVEIKIVNEAGESLAPNARDHEYLYQHDVGLSRLRRMMQKAAKEQLALREAQQGAA